MRFHRAVRWSWERAGEVADGVIGNAAARIAVPRTRAHGAGGGNIHKLVVGGAVGERSDADRAAFAVAGRRRGDLPGLPERHGDANVLRLQVNGVQVCVSGTVAEAVAIISRRIASAAGEVMPAGRARNNKLTSVKNRRMNPPRSASTGTERSSRKSIGI